MFDVAVLGAGMVGVSTAVELRRRGLSVALIDRREPGEETSYGNAGLIQPDGIHPAVFPRDLVTIIRHALKLETQTNYHFRDLPHVAPFLWRYFRASKSARMCRTVEANIPLLLGMVERHLVLASEADAMHLLRNEGWLVLVDNDEALRKREPELQEIADLGLSFDVLSPQGIVALEPHLETSHLAGAIHHKDAWNCSDPGALTKAYGRLFTAMGGTVIRSDIRSVKKTANGFAVDGTLPVDAEQVIVALGPWSKALLDGMGLRLPMGIKRGYHRHFRLTGNAGLNRVVLDEEKGFALAPMARVVRLTTGAEFARIEAPKTPVQLERVLPLARQLLPLGESVDSEPWLGARPCFPDMLPVIGKAPGMDGLWLNFGHSHHGFMLGPVTGLLLAEMLCGQTPFTDPAPYSALRFS